MSKPRLAVRRAITRHAAKTYPPSEQDAAIYRLTMAAWVHNHRPAMKRARDYHRALREAARRRAHRLLALGRASVYQAAAIRKGKT